MSEIIKEVATRLGITQKAAQEFYNTLLQVIHENLQSLKDGEKLSLTKLVTFKKVAVPERTHRNPKTGEPVVKAAHSVIKAYTPSAVDALAE